MTARPPPELQDSCTTSAPALPQKHPGWRVDSGSRGTHTHTCQSGGGASRLNGRIGNGYGCRYMREFLGKLATSFRTNSELQIKIKKCTQAPPKQKHASSPRCRVSPLLPAPASCPLSLSSALLPPLLCSPPSSPTLLPTPTHLPALCTLHAAFIDVPLAPHPARSALRFASGRHVLCVAHGCQHSTSTHLLKRAGGEVDSGVF